MPYKQVWVKPKVFMRYKGVTVYHTYPDNEYDQSVYRHTFTTDVCGDADNGPSFDVRQLKALHKPHVILAGTNIGDNKQLHTKYIKTIIKAAIDSGEIEKGDDNE